MGLLSTVKRMFKKNKTITQSAEKASTCNKSVEQAILENNNDFLAIQQLENYLWYKGDPDYLKWLHTVVMPSINKSFVNGGYRTSYLNRFWFIASEEKGVKVTHSGIPKIMVDTPIKCLGLPIIKSENVVDNNNIKEIIANNNFYQTFKTQATMDAVIGDGAYIINVHKAKNDYPMIKYYDGRHCKFEYTGDKITKVITIEDYEEDGVDYQCFEERGTIRELGANGYVRKAYIKYTLMRVGTGFTEVPLNTIKATEKLRNVKFNNIDEMLAVPCINQIDPDTKRGISFFDGKLDLFDDFDQNISQEANIMRAITPVEYIDEDALEHDPETLQAKKPSVFGKQIIYYKGTSNYNQAPERIHSTFYQIDFNKITGESLETLNRILAGKISPATLGLELARNSSDLSQREKEKITLQTIKDMKEYIIPILEKLFSLTLKVYDLMLDENAPNKEHKVQVAFKDYANPTLDSKIKAFGDAMNKGQMSPQRFIDECYGDESEEFKQAEKSYIESFINKKNETPTFSLSEV